MKSFTLSRLYAASIIGLGTVAIVVACDPGSDMTGTQIDMNATPDMTVVSDMTMFNAPTVTAVSPTFGANNVTTNITITGTDFRTGASVTVAGAACTNVVVHVREKQTVSAEFYSATSCPP